MKYFFFTCFLLIVQNSYGQYLNGNIFEYDVANDKIIEVYQNNNSLCEIDLKNQKIINDFYWFEDGIIYEIDTEYEQEIGKYSKNEITIYNETYKLEKPTFSKMRLLKTNDSSFMIKIACSKSGILIEENNEQISDVLKLWLVMKGTERVEKRNNNANIFIESLEMGGSFF